MTTALSGSGKELAKRSFARGGRVTRFIFSAISAAYRALQGEEHGFVPH